MSKKVFWLCLLLFMPAFFSVYARAETGLELLNRLGNSAVTVPPATCLLQRNFETCSSYDSCESQVPGLMVINACRYPVYIDKIETKTAGATVMEQVKRVNFYITDSDSLLHPHGTWHLYGSGEAECKTVSEMAQALTAEKRPISPGKLHIGEYQKFVGDCEKFTLNRKQGLVMPISAGTAYKFSGASEKKDAAGHPEYVVAIEGKMPSAQKGK